MDAAIVERAAARSAALRRAASSWRLPPQAARRLVAPVNAGRLHTSIQPLLRPRRMSSSSHAAIGTVSGAARLRWRRRDRRERGGSCCRVGAACNRRPRAHPAALDSLVARTVHDERSTFVELSARLVPSFSREALPTSILQRLGGEPAVRIQRLLAWLAPITTGSSPDGSRFLRVSYDRSRGPALAQKMACTCFLALA